MARGCSIKKVFLKTWQNLQEKDLCQNLFFNKVGDLRPATLFKKETLTKCFHVNFAKFLGAAFL